MSARKDNKRTDRVPEAQDNMPFSALQNLQRAILADRWRSEVQGEKR